MCPTDHASAGAATCKGPGQRAAASWPTAAGRVAVQAALCRKPDIGGRDAGERIVARLDRFHPELAAFERQDDQEETAFGAGSS